MDRSYGGCIGGYLATAGQVAMLLSKPRPGSRIVSVMTDRPRWTYMVIVNPADACWNDGPADAFDTTGLRLHEVMDDERLPVIG